MKKNKKIYRRLFAVIIATYVIFTMANPLSFFNQQKILNQYSQSIDKLSQKINEEQEYKEELAKQKEDVNSLEFIEQTAREKLDMYYPNERLYVDNGM